MKAVYSKGIDEANSVITGTIIELQEVGGSHGYDELKIGSFEEKKEGSLERLKAEHDKNLEDIDNSKRFRFIINSLGDRKTFQQLFDFHPNYKDIFPKETLVPGNGYEGDVESAKDYLGKIDTPTEVVIKHSSLSLGVGVFPLELQSPKRLDTILDVIRGVRKYSESYGHKEGKYKFRHIFDMLTFPGNAAPLSLQEMVEGIHVDEDGNLLGHNETPDESIDYYEPTMRMGIGMALLKGGEIKIDISAAYQKMPPYPVNSDAPFIDRVQSKIYVEDRISPISTIVPDNVIEALKDNFIPKLERFLTDICRMSDLEIAQKIVGDPLKEAVFEKAFNLNPRDLVKQSGAVAGGEVKAALVEGQLGVEAGMALAGDD